MTTLFTIERLPEPAFIVGAGPFPYALTIPGKEDRYLISREHLLKEFGEGGTWEGIKMELVFHHLDEFEKNPCLKESRGWKPEPIEGSPLTRLKEALGLAGTTDNYAVAEIVSACERFHEAALFLGTLDGNFLRASETIGPRVREWARWLDESRRECNELCNWKESAIEASRDWDAVTSYLMEHSEGSVGRKTADVVLERLKERDELKQSRSNLADKVRQVIEAIKSHQIEVKPGGTIIGMAYELITLVQELRGENSELKIKLGFSQRQTEHLVADKNKLIDEVNALQGDLEGARKASEQMCDYVKSFFEVLDVQVSNTRSFVECVADALLKVRDLKAENEKPSQIGLYEKVRRRYPNARCDFKSQESLPYLVFPNAGSTLWVGRGITAYEAWRNAAASIVEDPKPPKDPLFELAEEIAPPSPEDIRKVANWFLDVAQQLGQSPDAGPVAGR